MLYVHSLMGDARPGELDPAAVNPSVVELHARGRPQLGPLPRSVPRGGRPSRRDRRREDGDGPVRVISGAGIAVPNVELSLSVTGAAVPSTVRTNASGVATVA